LNDRIEDLGDLLAEGGAVVGGGTAIGYALGWVVGSVLRDAGARRVSAAVWARKGGQLGGIAGLVALTLRLFGVR
jgi:hypothetical protein